MKNKTFAAWLTFIGGPLGLHRFYLRGMGDILGWLLPLPTALGLYGIERVQTSGSQDKIGDTIAKLVDAQRELADDVVELIEKKQKQLNQRLKKQCFTQLW